MPRNLSRPSSPRVYTRLFATVFTALAFVLTVQPSVFASAGALRHARLLTIDADAGRLVVKTPVPPAAAGVRSGRSPSVTRRLTR